MEEILDIQSEVTFDESVSHYEIHAHQPYTLSNFNNSDEIRISIQHQDLNLLPCRSSIHVQGKLSKTDGAALARTTFADNAICYLFEDIRYELNAVEIDKCKNVGLTTLMKGIPSFNYNQKYILENAGWTGESIADDSGNFDVFIPLNMIFGFAEDYRKIIVNMKHELILSRSRTNFNAVMQTIENAAPNNTYETFKIQISKIEWLMPYVQVSNQHKIQLLRQIEKNKPIAVSFRSWELYEHPSIPASSRHVWTVKTSNQLEKPRFVILAFQTKRKDQKNKDASKFDHCNVRDVKLFLNSQYYPYGNMNLDITNNKAALLYDLFAHFQQSYYGKTSEPMISREKFISDYPLIVIDCSKQNETIKSAPVDIRLEFEVSSNFPAETSAYCLILHDRIVEYNPVSGDVKKLI
ncbi:uncharacterized protein LOC106658309 [Trichogramma pretiosum]|uniref:uncharacterized protein LOC106658309 n=1 Tax=Trichogramma pretiosum TaxID=7493 RepID=UPI0006C9C630|nr:uncharacterized protein LOC106658309 [Trichogramma pretiosum]